MRFLTFILMVALLSTTSCEDKKKATAEKEHTASEVKKDASSNEVISEEKNSEEKIINNDSYEKITNENVSEFLTKYGNDHPETKVKLTTRLGEITLELYKDTPLHRANFIYLIKQGYFTETQFHRVVPNFIIQGGNSDDVSVPRKRNAIGNDYLIPSEIKYNHTYGSISGAKEYRENPDKKSMPFEFFIFLGPQTSTSHLDGNYTVFGKVTQGMDVVEKIANLKQDDGEWPLVNVFIEVEVLN
ncbi:peptidylprolyl isomerase [Cochleicola gelatinilyticus]|uniref:Peptidyl-prolyl cis-trans isomerase n=1 Tax=Cochleicola gelatinilyticus TaxID=1763537 RepID=A0A167G9J9_9FLAO|nr:peptidylprolyl isomerase [Cochleicola gelatinilyticus]OAB77360.1 peptidylprolyl isomerase [Cochleicola gelatinilyticus]